MATRPRKKKSVKQSQPHEKNPHAVAMGKLGGKKGGLARARNLTAEERQAISRQGATARWGRKRKKKAKKTP